MMRIHLDLDTDAGTGDAAINDKQYRVRRTKSEWEVAEVGKSHSIATNRASWDQVLIRLVRVLAAEVE